MDKLNLETPDITEKNIGAIAKLFPNVITEGINAGGEKCKVVDFEKLKQELSDYVIDGDESYDFTWVGKREAMLESNKPIRKTLRPNREASENWDDTQNIYIEGDNLEALKLLQESYLGKVKMIYIDPPYNTGNDFVYRDNFVQDKESYEEELGTKDEEGNKLFQNTESNGRFHSDWCSMIYPRLKLARNLLSDDGVIFISIDDNEIDNLKKLCNEVFGEENFIAQLIWERAYSPKNDAKYISNSHDYVLMYSKSIEDFIIGRLPRTEEANARYSNPDNDPRGVWKSTDMSVKTFSESGNYPITTPSGNIVYPPAGRCWSLSKASFEEKLQDNRISFGADGNGAPRLKTFLSELKYDGMAPTSILFYKEVGHSQEGRQELKKLFNDKGYFDGPKPVRLLTRLLTLANLKEDDIVIDFFSGSATTAHAVMKWNAEHKTNLKFVMVQLPELCDEKSEAYKAGYKNICEIGKERIRRAGEKIKEENPDKKIDTGFRVFKVDDTNMNDVYYAPKDYNKSMLEQMTSNIKSDRTDEDLLYGVLLDWGVELSLPHKVETIDGKKVHIVNDNKLGADLIACFEENISETVVREIAKKQPTRVVFRDGSFNTDDHKINVEEIFKMIAPNTTVKVI